MEVSEVNIKTAVQAVKNGKVLACPTDTVYGLICDAQNRKAIAKIFLIKKRPKSKPFPVFVGSIRIAKELAQINDFQERFLKKIWPGGTTVVLNAKKGGTIGLRIPRSNFLLNLMKRTGPLIETSANLSGSAPALSAEEVLTQFLDNKAQPDIVIDGGKLKTSKPSQVIDLTKDKPVILRK